MSALGGFWGAQVTEMLGLTTTLECFTCSISPPELCRSLLLRCAQSALRTISFFFFFLNYFGVVFSVITIIFLNYISKFSRLLIVTVAGRSVRNLD